MNRSGRLPVVAGLAVMLPLAAALFAGCGLLRTGKQAPNVIVVMVDALRADHVGCYGYDRDTTPFIDSLAAEGLRCADCIAQAPWTAASVAGVFTSRYPSQTGVGAYEDSTGRRDVMKLSAGALPPDETTLAELMADGGYHTFAVITNPFLTDDFGMTQGFATVLDDDLDAAEIVDAAIAYVDSLGGAAASPNGEGGHPFFAYLHFMDVHAPNRPPEPYYRMYPTLDSAPHRPGHGRGGGVSPADMTADGFAVFKSHKLALYDGSLTYVDAQVERLVEYLRDAGLADDTVIVFAADHGEGLWDHGLRMGHGFSLYGEQLEVPLIIHGPGVPPGEDRVLARNLDIAPTLLALAGIGIPESMEGVDLLDAPEATVAYSEDMAYGFEQKSLRDKRFKYVMSVVAEMEPMLFDKSVDPDELADLSGRMPEIAAFYAAEIDSLRAGIESCNRSRVMVDEATRRKLRALGY